MMNYKLVLISGLVVLITPFLGIPSNFKNLIFLVVSIVLILYAFIIRMMKKNSEYENNSNGHGHSFVESRFGKESGDEELGEEYTDSNDVVQDEDEDEDENKYWDGSDENKDEEETEKA